MENTMPEEKLPPCVKCGTEEYPQGYVETFHEVDGEVTRTQVRCSPCADLDRFDQYREDGCLTTRLVTIAALREYDFERDSTTEVFEGEREMVKAIMAHSDRIQAKVKEFEAVVWFGGHDPVAEGLTEPYSWDDDCHKYKEGAKPPEGSLQEFITGETRSGHSASLTDASGVDIKLLSLAMCARWRMTIQHPDGQFIDVITEEDSCNRRMGTNGIGATADEAVALLDSTIAAWAAGDITFTTDGDVRILGT